MSIPVFSNLMRRMRTYEPIKTIEIYDGGSVFVLDQMKQEMDMIYDKIKNKSYSYTTNTIDFVVKKTLKPGTYRVALLDPLAGTTVELQQKEKATQPIEGTEHAPAKIVRSTTLFEATTNAALAGKAIDSQFMVQTFGVQFGMRQKIIWALACCFIGWLLGAAF
jgi:hypothetical protein